MRPNDFSVQYGVPGERTAPAVVEALDRVEVVTRRNEVALGAADHDPKMAIYLLDNVY